MYIACLHVRQVNFMYITSYELRPTCKWGYSFQLTNHNYFSNQNFENNGCSYKMVVLVEPLIDNCNNLHIIDGLSRYSIQQSTKLWFGHEFQSERLYEYKNNIC